ncbi:MAG: succinate dehydrogenase, cytochrome b556 subunit [Pseudomonadota bacterium]
MARNNARPLSPHLGIWKPGIHMTLSIVNRVMGAGLATVGVLALVWWLVAASSGAEAYATFMGIATGWTGYVVLIGLTFAFFLHMAMGIRHFVMDMGAGFDLKANRAWAWVTVIVAVVLTGLTWFVILNKGL